MIWVISGSSELSPVLLRDLLEDADEDRDDEGDDRDHHDDRDARRRPPGTSSPTSPGAAARRASRAGRRPGRAPPRAGPTPRRPRPSSGRAGRRRRAGAPSPASSELPASTSARSDDDRRLQHLVLGLLLERVEGAQHRHPGGDQGRELAREDRRALRMLTLLKRWKTLSSFSASRFSETSRTISPRWRSCSETWALRRRPRARRATGRPARSTARKAKVLTARPASHHRRRSARRRGGLRVRDGGAWSVDEEACVAPVAPLAPPSSRFSSSGTEARCSASERVIVAHPHELGEVGVHRLHPHRAGGLQRRVDLVGLALADQVADRRGRHQHLAARRPAPSRRRSAAAAG